MSPKNPTNSDLAAQIKMDMVNYIGPIFQELKSDIKGVKSELKEETHRLKEETHRLGILMEQMDRKIDTALEASSSVLKYEDIVKEHGSRIDLLERDLKILKAVRSPKT